MSMKIIKYHKDRCYAGQIVTPCILQPGEKLRLSPYDSTTGEYLPGLPRYFTPTKADLIRFASEEKAD